MKSALSDSIKAETKTVQSKFEIADNAIEDKQSTKKEKHQTTKKVVRDSFTFPVEDINLIGELKNRSLKCAINATKSEIIRAGLHALNAMSDKELVKILQTLEKVKTGRPEKS